MMSTSPDVMPAVTELPSPPEAARPWLHDAAIALGAAAEVAQAFADSGWLQINDIAVLLQPRSDAQDDWWALARVAKPAALDDARWHDALLTATGQTMLLAECAFALDKDDAALLTLRVPPRNCYDPLLLSADLYGMLCMAHALRDGVAGAAATNESPTASDEGLSHAEFETALRAAMSKPAFNPQMEALLRDGVACLGGDAATARRAMDEGQVHRGGRSVAFAADLEGDTLVLTTELAPGSMVSPQKLREVLRANLDLMGCAGVAVGRIGARPALIARWNAGGRSGEDFAEAIDAFAGLVPSAADAEPAEFRTTPKEPS